VIHDRNDPAKKKQLRRNVLLAFYSDNCNLFQLSRLYSAEFEVLRIGIHC